MTCGRHEERSLLKIQTDAQRRSATAEEREARSQRTAQAMQEYNARGAAIGVRTAQLRALRLAKEAEGGPKNAIKGRVRKARAVVDGR